MRAATKRRRVGSDRGAAAVELALVLPILLILVFGLIQYGWYFYQSQETSFAVREGARVAAVGTQDTSGVQDLVTEKLPSAAAGPTVTVCYTDSATPSGLSVGDQITVEATLAATDFNFPFVPFPTSVQTITQDAQTRTENVVSGTSDYTECL